MRGEQDPNAVRRLQIDIEGGLARLRLEFDPGLVERVRALPGRHFRPETREWVVPTRREALHELGQLAAELGDQAELTGRASRRLAPHIPGRIERGPNGFLLSFAFTPRRVVLVRALPDRRYEPERRVWQLSRSRAPALALLELLRAGEFVADGATLAELERLAQPRAAANGGASASGGPQTERASPTPHWRHVTRGAVFEANPTRREWVEGIGWCVRIRVDPSRRRRFGAAA